MASVLLRSLQALVVVVAIGGLGAGLYALHRYPWHRVNRASRIPVRRTTVEVTRYCVSAAFLLFVPIAIGGLLSFSATMAELRASASDGPPEYSILERVALALPWELVVAGTLVLAVGLVLVPTALVMIDVAREFLGGDDPPDAV